MTKATRPMRDVIAGAIYDDGSLERRGVPAWSSLSDERKADWLGDADRVIAALRSETGHAFQEFAFEHSGADWLANDPIDLWRDFMAASPEEACAEFLTGEDR